MTSNNATVIKSGNYMCKKLTSYHFTWSDRRDYSVPYDYWDKFLTEPIQNTTNEKRKQFRQQ